MKRWLLQISTLVAATAIASAAHAQVNLSWGDCDTFGTPDQVFNCAANSGAAGIMICSAIAPTGAGRVVAMEAVVDMIEANSSLQPWWQFNTGECRAGGISLSADFTAGPFSCADFWGGQGIIIGGTVANGAGKGANTLRFKMACAVPTEQSMTAAEQVYAFKIIVLKTKSTGAGSCAGCSDPGCLVLNSVLINQPAGVGDFLLTGAPTGGRDFATWQGGAGATCATVPAQNRTWGQVKALYR
jgi:hypothetical protein